MEAELINEIHRQYSIINRVADHLEELPISTEYKILFLSLSADRGLHKITEYKDEMIEIANLDCEIIKLLLVGKMCGLSTIHLIATETDAQKRADIYQAIKNNGVKNVDINKMLLSAKRMTLLDLLEKE